MSRLGRRRFIIFGSATLGTSLLLKACGSSPSTQTENSGGSTAPTSEAGGESAASGGGDTIKVGILHSLSGTMAISETTVVEAEKLAIKEINEAGGVLGKKIEPIVEDGASDWDIFKEKAEKLIDQDKVVTIFGCWTSASRKAVLDVFESKNHMLWYPVQYEGQECSKNVFYTGAAPNQQIEPAIDWLLKNKGKNFFLVGSDYVFHVLLTQLSKNNLKLREVKQLVRTTYL
jgi:urea transport system substrate-binding protein